MDDTKPFWHLFRHNRNDEKPSEIEIEAKLKEQIQALVRNGIFFDFEKRKAAPVQSKFGGKPALPKNSNGLTTPMNTANTSFSRFSCNYLAKNYRFTTQTISFHTKACSISFMISRINRGEIVREQNYYTPLLPFPN